MVDEVKGREFDIAQQVTELLDTLNPEQRKQIMHLLASRYGLTIKDPPAGAGRGYTARPKRKW